MTTAMWVCVLVGVTVGWLLNMAWDAFLDWLHNATADAGDWMRDGLALLGVLAVAFLVYHWAT